MNTGTKRYLLVMFSVILCYAAHAQSSGNILNIQVTGLRNDKGKVLISVFSSAKGFPENVADAVYRSEAKAKNGKASFICENLKAGNYAIAVLHDENENHKMDTKLFGLPKEGYGFSENVMGIFGPPSFRKANFSFPGQKEVIIKIKY